MHKTLVLSACFSSLLLIGCQSTTSNNQSSASNSSALTQIATSVLANQAASQAENFLTQNYQSSNLPQLETVRSGIEMLMNIALPAYQAYTGAMNEHGETNQYLALIQQAAGDSSKIAGINSGLSDLSKQAITAALGDSAVTSAAQQLASSVGQSNQLLNSFESFDVGSLLANVSASDLMAEKANIAYTASQVSYLKDNILPAYQAYQQLASLKN